MLIIIPLLAGAIGVWVKTATAILSEAVRHRK